MNQPGDINQTETSGTDELSGVSDRSIHRLVTTPFDLTKAELLAMLEDFHPATIIRVQVGDQVCPIDAARQQMAVTGPSEVSAVVVLVPAVSP